MKLSIIIPARNEERTVRETVLETVRTLDGARIRYEIIAVNDSSTDRTAAVLDQLARECPSVRYIDNDLPRGFGAAVRKGLEYYTGDAVILLMADRSDSPDDILTYYRKLQEGYDCVFGSRFVRGSRLENYPLFKLVLNRAANTFVGRLFCAGHNDLTNAFKAYTRDVIEQIKPLAADDFSLTVELALKAVVRGFRYATVPIAWRGRKDGVTKFRIKEMGSRYLRVICSLYREDRAARPRSGEITGQKSGAAAERETVVSGKTA